MEQFPTKILAHTHSPFNLFPASTPLPTTPQLPKLTRTWLTLRGERPAERSCIATRPRHLPTLLSLLPHATPPCIPATQHHTPTSVLTRAWLILPPVARETRAARQLYIYKVHPPPLSDPTSHPSTPKHTSSLLPQQTPCHDSPEPG